MKTEWLFAWYNLIFIVPFLLALLYVGLYSMSGLTFGDVHADAGDAGGDAHFGADGHVDVDADAHVDVDGEAHVDADVDADAHADVDGDAHVEADAGEGHEAHLPAGSVLTSVMSFLGVGRVPLSILLMVLLLTWGMIGFIFNYLLWAKIGSEELLLAVSIPAAAIGSGLSTRLASRAIMRWMPFDGAPVPRRHDLWAEEGERILPIDAKFGMVAVRNSRGDLFHIPVRRHSGQELIEKGTKVRLVSYNGKQQMYYVVQYDPAVASRTA